MPEMPNWCHNKLAVTGEREAVEAFVRKVQVTLDDASEEKQPTALTFQAHVPMPADVESYKSVPGSVMARIGEGGWYAWCVDHWGTKWDASIDGPGMAIGTHEAISAVRSDAENHRRSAWVVMDAPTDPGQVTATIDFETAYSPPEPWLRATAVQEPQLTFVLRYAEVGNDIAGEIRIKGSTALTLDLEVGDVLSEEERWF